MVDNELRQHAKKMVVEQFGDGIEFAQCDYCGRWSDDRANLGLKTCRGCGCGRKPIIAYYMGLPIKHMSDIAYTSMREKLGTATMAYIFNFTGYYLDVGNTD